MNENSPEQVVYFSDTTDVGDVVVARVGVGTEVDPFRVGLTCYQILQVYLDVQQQTSTTTVLHLITTFKVVRQRYPVTVIGYSDKCGHRFPFGYFFTSRRKKLDMAWCIRSVKRATIDLVKFSSQN
ncbi:hypothetical protein PHMEG_00016624 [Phytophthora megakarya]|uniref:Uncharacterized protein n=1 Tax=Phytophthora megakarya TaxID=4795 RepID=A0A225W0Y2_9STRA|nr:hypothetical protein PHMEG_00016624 [Phytophthora megakarya]